MRRNLSLLAVSAVVGALAVPGAVAAGPSAGDPAPSARMTAAEREALKAGLQVADKAGTASTPPAGANPFLALLPNPATADYAGWRKWLAAQGDQRAAAQARQRARTNAAAPPLTWTEIEAGNAANDTPATSERIQRFGTKSGKNPKVTITGTLSPDVIEAEDVAPSTEDDGAIPLARETGITGERPGIHTTGTVGDGPHGSAGTGTGDFDFYKVTAAAGQTITVDIDTPTGPLDSYVIVYNAAGERIALNDDSDGLDSFLQVPVPAAGDYFVMVAGFFALPADPTDPASGPGAGDEGPYEVTITVGNADVDVYGVYLRKGDILGASMDGAATWVNVLDKNGRNVHGSDQDASFIYSVNTPLPGGGRAVTDHVAEADGWHYVSVNQGSGDYTITVEAYRPVLQGKRKQTLFLDFDGARLNTAIFGGAGVRTLSPMRDFLPAWGLTAADENRVIDEVVKAVTENIKRDLSQINANFEIDIKNSRDHADTFGTKPDVSRVIVGGTIAESGVNTIGIAQSIDVGNFDANESALVLLDVLSEPAGDDPSLNTYITPASDKVKFVGRALGNVTAHEAGHFFGNFHVDQFNEQANLMDQGGNFPVMFAVGPDNVGGTADDPDVDFGEDDFNPNEGFVGVEDTATRLSSVLVK
jgi:hypothetical protein